MAAAREARRVWGNGGLAVVTTDAASGIKVSVVGPAGTCDLVLPLQAPIRTAAEAYAAEFGLAMEPTLATRGGLIVDPHVAVSEAGLTTGAVVVAVEPRVAADGTAVEVIDEVAPPRAVAAMRWAALVAAVVAAVVAATATDDVLRYVCGGLLAGAAVVAVQSRAGAAAAPVAPGLAAVAAFVLVQSGAPGATLVGIGAGGLVAAATAAVGRSLGTAGHDEHVQVWIWTGLGVAAVATGFLLAGISAVLIAPTLFGIAVLAARIAPTLAVQVPDHLLLDIDKLAVTAWSAHEKRGGKRHRTVVQHDVVDDVLHAGRRTVAGACAAIAAVAFVCAPVMAFATSGSIRLGNLLLLGFGGAALLFISRSHRARLPRFALAISGAWAFLAFGASAVVAMPAERLPLAATGAATVAFIVLFVAVALGSGWRSVWWARAGEIAESMSVVLALAVLPVAVGLAAFMRQLAS